jgi:hypothetical protein
MVTHKSQLLIICRLFLQCMVKQNFIRILLTQHNLELHQLDINITFLNGILDRDIYMEMFINVQQTNDTQPLFANCKEWYGLKQSFQT